MEPQKQQEPAVSQHVVVMSEQETVSGYIWSARAGEDDPHDSQPWLT